MTAAKVPAWLGEVVETLGPLAEGFIRRALTNHSDELPVDVRERVRSIIAPALERGEASAKAIDEDIAATKARIGAADFEERHKHEHTADGDGEPATIDPDATARSGTITVGDDDDGDAA